jgi:hypothetical protein
MSDTLSLPFLLAAAPLRGRWEGPDHIPLAALPCLADLDFAARNPFREEP